MNKMLGKLISLGLAAALALFLAACAAQGPDSATAEGGWALNAAEALDELEARGLIDAIEYRDRLDKKLTCAQAAELICLTFDLTNADYLDYVLSETSDTASSGGKISRERFMWWVSRLGGAGEVGVPYAEEQIKKFTDHAKIKETYYAGVAQLAGNQIIFGDGNSRLMSRQSIITAEAISVLARAVKARRLAYSNPHSIVITQPEEIYRTTTGSHVSILGACDCDYPLYMNGVEIPTTPRGFFTQYVELKDGDNTFVFTNNDKEETVIITKKAPGTYEPPEAVVYDTPVYAFAVSDHISHMANPGEDTNLLTPLAKGTVLELTGEIESAYGTCYITESGTYIYKSSVEIMEEEPPENTVTGARIIHQGRFTRVKFDMDVNTFYSIERKGKFVRLTFNAASDESGLDPTGTPITDIVKTAGDGTVTYEFTFKEAPTGHYVEFNGGQMIVEFKYAPKSLDGAKVILDAGHGGEDPGAKGPPRENGPVEKDFNLHVAYAAKAYLESRGATVLLTRSDDTRVPLADRVSETLSEKPDIFVSVHSNALPVTKDYSATKGPLMFYTFDTSLAAAEHIYKTVTDYFGLEYRKPINDNFAVTRVTICPTMLFEMSFMCNLDDYEWLLLKDTMDDMGEALGKGIEGYIGKRF